MERHINNFEFNMKYKDKFEEIGCSFSGISPDEAKVEIMELTDHPYFVACQFHPEFKSRPNRPAPLFIGLIEEAKKR